MIKIENTGAYTHVRLLSTGEKHPIPDFSARVSMVDAKPAELHALSKMGLVLGLDALGTRLNTVLNRDNAWEHSRRTKLYDGLAEALLPFGKPISEAKKILANRDLRPEIVAQRARETVTKALPDLTPALEKIVVEAAKEPRHVDRLQAEVWTPDPEDRDAHAKAREVRDILRAMPDGERTGLLLESAKLGRLEVLGAVKSDPFGILAARLPERLMPRLELEALRAAGLGWLHTWREDAHETLTTVAALADLARSAILAAVPGEPMELPYNVKPLQAIANEALAA